MRATLRTAIAIAVLALSGPALTGPARAQDAAPAETPPAGASADTPAAEPAPAEPAPAATDPAAGTESAAPPAGTAAAAAPAMPPAPPIMVAAIATGRVPVETVDAVRAAIVAQVEPMAGGRPVLPLLAPELQAAIAACSDAPCVGGQIAGAGAVGAIVARLSRRGARGPIDLRIEMIDPVSGAPRTPPIVYSLADGADVAASIGPLVAQLRAAMFSPPPPPPQILVTVNVDGATVRIDDEVIGESPVAARVVTPGRHVIQVQRAGYSGVRREVDVDLGENERVDITLAEALGAVAGGEGAPGTEAEQQWYENWVVWAGVGAGAVAVGVGIGVSVAVASQPQTTPDPTGIPLPPIQ